MKCLIVGIAGGSGSGKTTVAKNIMKALPDDSAVLIEFDSYYKDRSDLSFEERRRLNYDHPDSLETELLREHLKRLKQGLPIEKPVYDFVTHSRKKETVTVNPAPIIIVEGILLFAIPELREMFDIKIFVDTDSDIRLIRRIQRDIEERGRSLESVIEQYYSTVRPMHLEFVEPSKRWADIIIPEGGYNPIALELIIERLKRFLEK